MITKMTKYTFLLLSSDTEDFLRKVQDLGVIDITRSRKPVDSASARLFREAEDLRHEIETVSRCDYSKDERHITLSSDLAATEAALAEKCHWGDVDAEQVGDCWAVPFADTPVDTELICENVYMNVLKKARERVWFLTPYLALSDEMKRELEQAAGRGLDVRIVLPGIPDSRFVHRISRSYYYPLAEAGVRIYEYTPGFCHAKMCVADGDTGVVGTANLDFRSLYLNFEDAVLLHGRVCEDVEKDFKEIFPVCEEVTGTYRENAKKGRSILHCLYRIIAPLF